MDRDDIQYDVEDILKDVTELDEVSYSDIMEITDKLFEQFEDKEELDREDIVKAIKDFYKKRDDVDLTLI